jgi:PKD repeat protein
MKKRIITFLVLFVTLISLSTVANAQVIGSVSLGPRPALRDDDLVCSVTGGSRNQEYYWYKNGVKIDSLTDTKIPDNSRNSILGAGNTSSTNTWTCEVVTWPDHMLIGSDSVYIENTDPVNAQIIPDPASSLDNLTCGHDGTSTYVFEWYLNGIIQNSLTEQTINASNTARDDVWTCYVIHSLVGVRVGEDNITVSNSAPVLDSTGIQTVAEDNVLNFVLTGTDTDSDSFNFTLVTNTTNGVVTLNDTTGAVSYTPNGNYTGPDNFSLYLTDGADNGATETIQINVAPVNDAPSVSDIINVTFNEDESNNTIDLDSYVYDIDGDIVNWTYSGNTNVFVSIDENNTITFNATQDWNGVETITFTATDPGLLSDSDNVVVTVNPIDDAPVAYDVSSNTDEDTEVNITLSYDDVDGDLATECDIVGLVGGLETTLCSCDLTGVCTVGITPSANLTDTVFANYYVNNTYNSNLAFFNISVNPINDAPIMGDIPDVTFYEDGINNTIDLDDYILDVDNDTINWTYIGNTNIGISIDENNTITFNSTVAEWSGAEIITFTATDPGLLSDSDNVTVTVIGINDVPIITGHIPLSTVEETSLTIYLENLTVIDPDNVFPDNFTLTVLGGGNYTVLGNTITPVIDFSGVLSVPVTINDSIDVSDVFNLSVTVTDINDAPVAYNILANTNEDTPIIIELNYTDVEGAQATACNLSNVIGGTDSACVCTAGNCSVTLTPLGNSSADITAEYTVNDGLVDSNTANITVTVNAVNDIPIIEGQAVPLSTPEETSLTIYLENLTVSDPDNVFPDNFTLTVLGGANYTVLGNTITPVLDFEGILTVPVTVNDSIDVSNVFNLAVTVSGANDAPVFDHELENQSIGEGYTFVYDINASDVDVLDVLSFTSNVTALGGSIDANGILTLLTDNNIVGNHTINVTVCDNGVPIACVSDTFDLEVINIPFVAETNGPYIGFEGTSVSFSAYDYRWDFENDGQWDTAWVTGSAAATHTYPDNFTGLALLQINDSTGAVINGTASVTIANVAPTANANGNYSCIMGDTITLTGTATDPAGTNDTLTYEWDIDNDGTYEINTANVNVSCTTFGIYPISFRASDEDGGIGVNPAFIFIGAPNMSLSINGPYSGVEGSPITFNATVIGGLPPHQYAWDIDGDGTLDTPWTSNPTYSYTWYDDYNGNVSVQINDSTGDSLIDSTTITINNSAPIASADGPYNCILGENRTLYGSATDTINDTLNFAWDLNNDGTYETIGQNVTFTCTGNGTYQVNLRVLDDDGGIGLASSTVTTNVPSILLDAGGPYSGAEGYQITFTGSASGGASPYQFRWDFDDDGLFDTVWSSTADANATYTDDYSGVAVLQLMDSIGSTVNDTAAVTVSNIAPIAEANGAYFCNQGDNITLTGSVSDPGTGDTITFSWDLNNDGTYETTGQNPSFLCISEGIITVNLEVSDDDGGVSIDSAVINIGAMQDTSAPTVVINSPAHTNYTHGNITIDISASDVFGVDKVWYTLNGGANIDYYTPVNQTLSQNTAYTLRAYANDTNGNVGSASVVFIINSTYMIKSYVPPPKSVYQAKLNKIRMSSDGFLIPGEDLRTTISITNTGNEDLEDTRVTVVIPELGIWKRVSLDIDEGDKETREVVIDIPDDVEPGEYMARIVVSNSKTRRVVHRPVVIE